MRRRGCLFGCTGVLGLIAIGCALIWFVGLPRLQDQLRDDLSGQLSTQVSRQISAQLPAGVQPEAGVYRLSLSDIEQQLSQNWDQSTFSAPQLRTEGEEIVLAIGSSGQSIEFRGVPTVGADGQLEMTGMSSNGGALDYVLSPETLGGAVEGGVNNYLGAQGLHLLDVRTEGDELIFDVGE